MNISAGCASFEEELNNFWNLNTRRQSDVTSDDRTDDDAITLFLTTISIKCSQPIVHEFLALTSVFGRRAFPVMRSTCSWQMITYVGKHFALCTFQGNLLFSNLIPYSVYTDYIFLCGRMSSIRFIISQFTLQVVIEDDQPSKCCYVRTDPRVTTFDGQRR